jgi:hypothetical protein
MALLFLTWAFETMTALAISGLVTGAALFLALALLLHQPRPSADRLHPFYAEGVVASAG